MFPFCIWYANGSHKFIDVFGMISDGQVLWTVSHGCCDWCQWVGADLYEGIHYHLSFTRTLVTLLKWRSYAVLHIIREVFKKVWTLHI